MDVISVVDEYRRVAGMPLGRGRDKAWLDYQTRNQTLFAFYDGQYGTLEGRQATFAQSHETLPGLATREVQVRQELAAAHQELLNHGFLSAGWPVQAMVMVGGDSSNAWVDVFEGTPTIFVALETLRDPTTVPVLLRHELIHIAHMAALWDKLATSPTADQAAFRVWAEGIAVAGSRLLLPGKPEHAYFFESSQWLAQCQRTAPILLDAVLASSESTDPRVSAHFIAVDTTQPWPSRAGYWLADTAVTEQLRRGHDFLELLHWPPAQAAEAIRQAQPANSDMTERATGRGRVELRMGS